jgi:hypothetical protein
MWICGKLSWLICGSLIKSHFIKKIFDLKWVNCFFCNKNAVGVRKIKKDELFMKIIKKNPRFLLKPGDFSF